MPPLSEAFTLVEDEPTLFDDYHDLTSARMADMNAQLVTALRNHYPELIVTTVSSYNCSFLGFAAAGHATAELDTDHETILSVRGVVGPARRGGSPSIGSGVLFARYHYKWGTEDFILYTVGTVQYILKEPRGDETPLSNSSVVDALLLAIGTLMFKEIPAIYVYDRYWRRSTALWEQVSKAKWDDVILDPKMKKALTEVAGKFFDSEDIYKEYGVPWKRGLIFYGPAGNGKTISLKALMHTLYERSPPVVTLYVKSASTTYDIGSVFNMARQMTPCMLVFEDIDTIVTQNSRSYFFNEVDGLENNDGILMIATTNHLDHLDPGLSSRPSRFDRKYLFPMPNLHERALYAGYWRNKLKSKESIDFPKKLCEPMAEITKGFSFAYLKEAFVATLLELARNNQDEEYFDDEASSDDDDPNDKYELWRAFKAQVDILRKEIKEDKTSPNESSKPKGVLGGLQLDGCADIGTGREEICPIFGGLSLHGPPQRPQRQEAPQPREASFGTSFFPPPEVSRLAREPELSWTPAQESRFHRDNAMMFGGLLDERGFL